MQVKIELLPYQMRLLKSTKPYLALIGGTGSGKTFFASRWIYIKMCEYPNEEWIVSSPTREMLKRNAVKYITHFFRQNHIPFNYNKADLVIEMKIGTIYFISAETPDRMQGIHAKGIIGDEAGLFDRLWWDTAVQRISLKKGQILLTTTPYSQNWLKKEVWDRWISGDPLYHVENPSSLDNPFYPQEEYERAKKSLPDWKFRMLYHGQFTKPQGLIYEDYELIEPVTIYKGWNFFAGVDFGFNNPFAVVWFVENPETGQIFAYKEFKRSGLTIDDMEKVLSSVRCVYYADPSNKEALETLKARGIDIRAAKKDVLAGISFVQALLKSKKIKIFKNLPHLIDELSSYQWEMDRGGEFLDKPKKINDHLMDAMRYALFSYLRDSSSTPVIKTSGIRRESAILLSRF